MKIDKSWYVKPKDPNFPSAIAAGGVVIRRDGQSFYIALIRDRKYKDCLLPKGGVERGETIKDAAIREVSEEAGLNNLKLICELAVKERLTYEKNQWRQIHYFLFITGDKKGKQNLQKGEEDYLLEWHKLNKLPSMFWPEQRQLINENRERIKELLK